jgi:hypothetical protein
VASIKLASEHSIQVEDDDDEEEPVAYVGEDDNRDAPTVIANGIGRIALQQNC